MKTNRADFDLFVKECMKWIDRYSLHNYKFCFKHDEVSDAFAEYYFGDWQQKITIVFSKDFDGDCDKNRQIKDTAFHEITEILLSPLRNLASERNFSTNELEKETHAVIHRLQKALAE